jgi:hypothetical protein
VAVCAARICHGSKNKNSRVNLFIQYLSKRKGEATGPALIGSSVNVATSPK